MQPVPQILPKAIVLDTSPFLQRNRVELLSLGLKTQLYTIPQVFLELKDAQSKALWSELEPMLRIREPSAEGLLAVIEFAKKSGDFSVLSTTDLRLMGLVWSLDKELSSECVATVPENKTNEDVAELSKVEELLKNMTLESSEKISVDDPEVNAIDDEDIDQLNNSEEISLGENLVEITKDAEEEEEEEEEEEGEEVEKGNVDDGDDDDGGGWITAKNISRHKQRDLYVASPSVNTPVNAACYTSDFAMQNVLLQMGLRLVNLQGLVINKVKSYVLRCHACYKICTEREKKFCPRCGGPTLTRVTAQVSQGGELRLFLKKNFEYRVRGTKFGIPKPHGGKKGADLVFREDQKEYQRAEQQKRREQQRLLKKAANNEDIPWTFETANSMARPKAGINGTIGFGRKNPNEAKRRIHKKNK